MASYLWKRTTFLLFSKVSLDAMYILQFGAHSESQNQSCPFSNNHIYIYIYIYVSVRAYVCDIHLIKSIEIRWFIFSIIYKEVDISFEAVFFGGFVIAQ